jgi:hypothetical protein
MFLLLEGILALGFIPLLIIVCFIGALTWGVAIDRSAHCEGPKWWIFGIGLCGLVVNGFFNAGWTLSSVLGSVFSWQFWEPVLVYVGLGLVYSVVEFYFEIRRHASYYAEKWSAFIAREKITVPAEAQDVLGSVVKAEHKVVDVLAHVNADATSYLTAHAKIAVGQFIRTYSDFGDNRIVKITAGVDGLTPTPVLDKLELAEHVGAWVVLWPFYLLSLVLGDLLQHIWDSIASLFVRFGGRLMHFSFTDVFHLDGAKPIDKK